MAKPFNKPEKERIREKLLSAGLIRFARQGVRAVRIDDLAQDVGIAKGSFYAFFKSKEDLFMAMALDRESMHRKDMRQLLARRDANPDIHAARIFDMLIKKIRTDPVLCLMIEHGEIEYLLRKIPPEVMQANAQSDAVFIEELTTIWNLNNPTCKIDTDTYSALMTLMVALMMQVRLLPSDKMSEALNLLRQTFVTRLSSNQSTPLSPTAQPGH